MIDFIPAKQNLKDMQTSVDSWYLTGAEQERCDSYCFVFAALAQTYAKRPTTAEQDVRKPETWARKKLDTSERVLLHI